MQSATTSPPPPFGLLGRIFLGSEDERVYAAIRISFALTAFYNLALIWPLREALFATTGSLDLDAAIEHSSMGAVGLFHWFQSPGEVTLLLSMVAIALLLLAAGILPRLAAVIVFLWHLSYFERAPLALTGWDLVLRSFSFLLLVSPLGKCWTLPAWRRQRAFPQAQRVARYGLVLMRLQVAVIYLQTAVAKVVNVNPYWREGEFMPYFLLSHHARWPSAWAAENADTLMLATYLALATEIAIPILLLIRRTRWWGILLGVSFHGFISIVSRAIEPFMIVMMMSYVAFLTRADVEWLHRSLTKKSVKSTPIA